MPKLYLWQNKNSDSNNEVTLKLVVRIGSLQETDSQLGYAHFVEHMAFNGSAKFPDGALQTRLKELGLSIGAHSNAFTTFDRTVYTLYLKSADKEWGPLLVPSLAVDVRTQVICLSGNVGILSGTEIVSHSGRGIRSVTADVE